MRVILVDDEPIILEDLKIMLERYENIEVVGMYTEPEAALQGLSSARPDCAFLDIELAGLSGIELAEKLSAINPDLEIIFVTAYNHYPRNFWHICCKTRGSGCPNTSSVTSNGRNMARNRLWPTFRPLCIG